MPFVKDKLYKDMAFSNETPADKFHAFLTVTDLIAKINQNRNCAIKCRTVGTISCDYGEHVLHEIDDHTVQIRLSLTYVSHAPPFTGKPYPAQVFGFILWKDIAGPTLYPHRLKALPAYIAVRLRDTMKWVVETHYASLEDKKEE